MNTKKITELEQRAVSLRASGDHNAAARVERMVEQERTLADPEACLACLDEYLAITDRSEQQVFALENMKVLQRAVSLRESGYEAPGRGASLVEQHNAITDPAARTQFYRRHKAALVAEARMEDLRK